MAISKEEFLKGKDVLFPLNEEQAANMKELLLRINRLRAYWDKPMIVTSGYRPASYNKEIGGAPNSKHITCQAIDIADPTGALMQHILNNPNVLKEYGFWMESPLDTQGWLHLQIVPPSSGLRIFRAGKIRLLS